MFACRVNVGEFCLGKTNARAPDARPGLGNLLYDSTTNDLANPIMFVTYNDAQAYPEYLIQFTNLSVPDLYSNDVNLAEVSRLLATPKTQAVRLHGSHNAQRLLGEVTTRAQMAVLRSRSSPPVVVLVGGDTANTKRCAKHLLGAWKDALARAGVAGTREGKAWYVSNHSFAVSMDDIHTEVPQDRLPPGCAS